MHPVIVWWLSQITNHVCGVWPRQASFVPRLANGAHRSTRYTSDMLRAFNFLVETWDMKRPYESELGDDEGMLVVEGPGDGHVPRNFRLAMLFLDVVQVGVGRWADCWFCTVS